MTTSKLLAKLSKIEDKAVAKATLVEALNTMAAKKYKHGTKDVCNLETLQTWLGLRQLFADLYFYHLKSTTLMPSGLSLSVDTGGAK